MLKLWVNEKVPISLGYSCSYPVGTDVCMICDYGAYFATDGAANSNSSETVNVVKNHKLKMPKNPQTKQKTEKKCLEFWETL